MTAGQFSYPFVQCHPKNYGKGRQGYQPIWFVMHCTDDEYSDRYPANLGNYWKNNPVQVSVHFAVSDYQTYQYVDCNDTAFQARNPGNLRGIGVELSGLKSWSRNQWLAHKLMIRRAAQLCAEVSGRYGFKVNGQTDLLAAVRLKARASGVTQHADLTDCFGGSHQDLGTGFPWDVFWQELHRAYAPLAAQAATIAATQAAAQEEEEMAVTDAQFAALVKQVADIHGVLVSGKTYGGSWLQKQLGYVVGKIGAVGALLDSFMKYEKADDAEHHTTPGG